jgi:HSP20 family molecular chaperone IbpA
METETPLSTNTSTTESPPSSSTGPEGAPAGQPGKTAAPPSKKRVFGKSTLAIGSVAILALGMLLGIGVTRFVTSIPAAAAATKGRNNALPPVQNAAGRAVWNPFQELRDMQLHMDQMFDDMTTQFRQEPRLSFFADNPGYSLSLRVQDLKDHYEVRAHLPDANASDVNVSLLDKQTLKVEVTNKTATASSQKKANTQVTEWGQYAQIIQLPTPVKGEQMKIDRPSHELIVTLPKA